MEWIRNVRSEIAMILSDNFSGMETIQSEVWVFIFIFYVWEMMNSWAKIRAISPEYQQINKWTMQLRNC